MHNPGRRRKRTDFEARIASFYKSHHNRKSENASKVNETTNDAPYCGQNADCPYLKIHFYMTSDINLSVDPTYYAWPSMVVEYRTWLKSINLVRLL